MAPDSSAAWVPATLGAIFGFFAYRQFRSRWQSLADAEEISQARQLNLFTGEGGAASSRPPVRAGELVHVTGEVTALAEPLLSFNKEKSVVIETTVKTERTRYNSPFSIPTYIIKSRTVRDAPWALTPGASNNAKVTIDAQEAISGALSSVSQVQIERDAARRGTVLDSSALMDLLPGGADVRPREQTWATVARDFLWGQSEGDTLIVDAVLPVGVAASVLGRADVHGGVLFVGLHPRLGFYAHRSNLSAVVGAKVWSARWSAVFGVVLGAVAASLLMDAYRVYKQGQGNGSGSSRSGSSRSGSGGGSGSGGDSGGANPQAVDVDEDDVPEEEDEPQVPQAPVV
jgi:uncharacterized membrane protein YgcG